LGPQKKGVGFNAKGIALRILQKSATSPLKRMISSRGLGSANKLLKNTDRGKLGKDSKSIIGTERVPEKRVHKRIRGLGAKAEPKIRS